jgi:hypothetical protein
MTTTTFVNTSTIINADWLNDVDEHVYDQTTDAHTAANITNVPSGNLSATDVQSALGELQTDVDDINRIQFATIAAMVAATEVSVGDLAYVQDYATDSNSGVLVFEAVAAATGTADGGSYIDSTGSPTVQFKQNFPSVISVKMFGATGDGTTDDTTAIQAAIEYFSSGLGRLYIPDGTYLVTSTLTVAQDRIHIYGAGQHATRIKFEPTANDVCFDITKGASVIYQGSLSNMAFVSDDSTYTKTAVKISDHSGYVVENIASYPWTGSNSIGIELHGREFGVFRNLYLSADRPIVIGTNPNNSISIDHHHFTDLYLTANGNPCVEILTGVNLTQVTFDGANPWVLGTNGLKWVDTTTSSASNGLILRGVRTEQGTSATAYAIDIQHNLALQNLVIDECYLGGDREGIYLRNVVEVLLSKSYYVGSTGRVPLNVDSTVSRMKMIGMFWQSGSTASVTGQNILLSGELSGAGLYVDATYTTNTTRDLILGGSIYEKTIELADNATAEIAPASSQGMLFVNDSEGLGAQFHLRGTYNTTTEVADPVGVFSVTATTGSSTNVYWSAGNSRYEIENKRGATRRYRILLIGKYGTF